MSPFDYKPFLKSLTTRPGVYRMLDEQGEVIYVGKAKNLKNRVSSYFRSNSSLAAKTQAMVSQIHNIEITITHTEAEALLLECNLIKKIRPRYNILLKDDKSYPYIKLSQGEYPRISFYRGNKKKDAEYFGPYPSAGSVKETLNLLQKLFKVRQCEDSYFRNRSRPCLQYQIKRCSAPCVDYISEQEYAQDLQNTRLFLQGRSKDVVDNLVQRMDQAAQSLKYEEAAIFRDQIQDVQRIAERQYVSGGSGNADVLVVAMSGGVCCVQGHFVRGGQSLGGKSFFPRIPKGTSEGEALQAFILQYYLKQPLPEEIVLRQALPEAELVLEALALHSGSKVKLIQQARGEKAGWVRLAKTNAEHALAIRLSSREGMGKRLNSLKELLGLDGLPSHMECFDISHTRGEATVASCVVFGTEGPRKDAYRRFNISGITPGDDYAAMHQALTRRYSRVKKEQGALPDILFIDGGKGQVSQAQAVLDELELADITIVGVSKGPERKAGEETLILPHQGVEFNVAPDTPGLHLIQQIRDESHRFAITGHRGQRAKARKQSVLEGIPGVGNKRRQELIKRFGGIQGIMRAGVEDLAQVPGISKQLAELIYDTLNK